MISGIWNREHSRFAHHRVCTQRDETYVYVGSRKKEKNMGIRIPGVVRVLGCVGVAFGPPTTLDAAGLYALRSDPPRGRVLLPPT